MAACFGFSMVRCNFELLNASFSFSCTFTFKSFLTIEYIFLIVNSLSFIFVCLLFCSSCRFDDVVQEFKIWELIGIK